jgi:hypothetical protein
MFIVLGYDELRLMARDFLCGHGRAHTEDQFDLSTIGVLVTGQVAREHFTVEVEA